MKQSEDDGRWKTMAAFKVHHITILHPIVMVVVPQGGAIERKNCTSSKRDFANKLESGSEEKVRDTQGYHCYWVDGQPSPLWMDNCPRIKYRKEVESNFHLLINTKWHHVTPIFPSTHFQRLQRHPSVDDNETRSAVVALTALSAARHRWRALETSTPYRAAGVSFQGQGACHWNRLESSRLAFKSYHLLCMPSVGV